MRIFLCPALMETLGFLVTFAVLYGAGTQHMTTAQCAWLGAMLLIAFMPASLVAGCLLSGRNARPILLISTALSTLAGGLCLIVTGFTAQLTGLGLLGVTTAFFFNSFQTFMRREAAPGRLSLAVGRYALACYLGAGLGFVSSGCAYAGGRPVLIALTLIVGAVMWILLAGHRPRAPEAPSADEHVEQGPADARPVNPGYVWIGWMLVFTSTFIQRPVLTFYPAFNAQGGVSSWLTSLPLFLQMALQGLCGWGMIYFRHLLYRRTPLVLFGAGTLLLFLGMWLWPGPGLMFFGISALGIPCGFFCFSAVYYASNSGRRSWNIGVNEFLGCLGSLTGLLASEGGLRLTGRLETVYLVCGLAVVILLSAQLILASAGRTARGSDH